MNHNFRCLVVSYSISTSNHNFSHINNPILTLYLIPFLHQTTTQHVLRRRLYRLYLIPFLHQTTTVISRNKIAECCILFHFYIKPQHYNTLFQLYSVVSYSISTSNHNMLTSKYLKRLVVSYSISTSNHNPKYMVRSLSAVVSYSISTSNHNIICRIGLRNLLYLIPFLHQTTTSYNTTPSDLLLYLIPFLHQTTTMMMAKQLLLGCILFHFYIKPQPPITPDYLRDSCILFHFYIKPQLV